MKLSEKIVLQRKRRGMSQEELAEKLDISRQAVSRWEQGTAMPDAENLVQLSRLFAVTTDYLLYEEYSDDRDIPAVKQIREQCEQTVSAKKRAHLIAAVSFLIAWIFSVIGIAESINRTQTVISCITTGLTAFCSVVQFALFFR